MKFRLRPVVQNHENKKKCSGPGHSILVVINNLD